MLFTTTAVVVSEQAVMLRMNIRDFLPLVYHGHPGATTIVQSLGKSLVRTVYNKLPLVKDCKYRGYLVFYVGVF